MKESSSSLPVGLRRLLADHSISYFLSDLWWYSINGKGGKRESAKLVISITGYFCIVPMQKVFAQEPTSIELLMMVHGRGTELSGIVRRLSTPQSLIGASGVDTSFSQWSWL